MNDVLYRYFNDLCENGYGIRLVEYPIRRRTNQGVWVWDAWEHRERFIRLTARVGYRHDTKDKALAAFIKRRERQILILTVQLEEARETLTIAQSGNVNKRPSIFDVPL